jgi:hypothetical protein
MQGKVGGSGIKIEYSDTVLFEAVGVHPEHEKAQEVLSSVNSETDLIEKVSVIRGQKEVEFA